MDHLAGVSDDALEDAVLDALRELTRQGAEHTVGHAQLLDWTMRKLNRPEWTLQNSAAIGANVQRAYKAFKQADGRRGEPQDARRVESIVWTMISRGILYPRFSRAAVEHGPHMHHPPWTIEFLVLTPVGQRVVSATDAHPSRSDFVQRIVAQCPSLPVEAQRRLEDAHDCVRQGLLRAGIIMLGLAYEHTAAEVFGIASVLPKLVANKQLHNNCERGNAKAILEGLREALAQKSAPKQPSEEDLLALHLADSVRQFRNMAAHDWARSFSKQAEAEDLLTTGARNLPRLWDLQHRV